MTKQIYKVWSADRIHKTAVLVSLDSDDIFTDVLTKCKIFLCLYFYE